MASRSLASPSPRVEVRQPRIAPGYPSPFLDQVGSPGDLAKGHLLDVCSLSRRANPEPVSASLQDGIRFFQHPVPQLHGLPLRSACLSQGCIPRNDPGLGEGREDRGHGGEPERSRPSRPTRRDRGGKIGFWPSPGGDTGFPRSAFGVRDLRHLQVDRVDDSHEPRSLGRDSCHFTVWFKPVNLIWLVLDDGPCTDSSTFAIVTA